MHVGTEQYFIEPVKRHSQVNDDGGHPHLVYRRTALQQQQQRRRRRRRRYNDVSMCGLDSEGDVTLVRLNVA